MRKASSTSCCAAGARALVLHARAFRTAAAALILCACAHALTPAQQEMRKRGDCAELLHAADAARASGAQDVAEQLARGCDQERFLSLVSASPPAEALLWCGRARVNLRGSGDKPSCDGARVADLLVRLRPRITLGPADPEPTRDPALLAALEAAGQQLNFAYDPEDPMVIVGHLAVQVEHQQTSSYSAVPNAAGKRHTVPVVQHRFVARAEGQAEIVGRTRTLRAGEEARDATWDAVPHLGIAAKPLPEVPPEDELRRRAAASWLRTLARMLATSPPEGVDTGDAAGCLAYAQALNAATGDPDAAMNGFGDPERVATCERLLGMPAGAGIPVP
ncbi:MAG TPA: hypothetical protein VN883_14110 [Myxococcales bacterium]|nr:hypothetical protein [Myxococcales bacterium]